jgi:hypothetical protein
MAGGGLVLALSNRRHRGAARKGLGRGAAKEYLAALQFKPERAETLYRIGVHYQAACQYHLSHLFFSRAMNLPRPAGARLFVEQTLYDFLLPLEYAVACFYVGEHGEALRVNNELLRGCLLPPHAIEQVIRNRRFSLDALFPPPNSSTPERGRLKVCVPFRDPGSSMDETVESLKRQSLEEFEAVFIDAGSSADHSDRLTLDDPRFSLIQQDAASGWEECVMRFARDECAPEDIIVPLLPGERLTDSEALQRIRLAFKAADCLLLYGQHRRACGKLGDAEPAHDEQNFNERGLALASLSPLNSAHHGLFRGVEFRQSRLPASLRSTPRASPTSQPPSNAGRMKASLVRAGKVAPRRPHLHRAPSVTPRNCARLRV